LLRVQEIMLYLILENLLKRANPKPLLHPVMITLFIAKILFQAVKDVFSNQFRSEPVLFQKIIVVSGK
jgi:hypothetical protein